MSDSTIFGGVDSYSGGYSGGSIIGSALGHVGVGLDFIAESAVIVLMVILVYNLYYGKAISTTLWLLVAGAAGLYLWNEYTHAKMGRGAGSAIAEQVAAAVKGVLGK